MAHVLTFEIQQLALEFGIERLGFLTFTFRENLRSLREAQTRFHSLNSNVIKARYTRAIGVWERQKRGAIHFHLCVVLNADIRTGFDFDACLRRDYRSANPALRAEWAFWRKTAPLYGFGRTELLPVKSTADGIAKYVGKYVAKHIEQREEQDKGARCVRFIGYAGRDSAGNRVSLRKASCRLAWAGGNSRLWREKLQAFASATDIDDLAEMRKLFGPRWAYHLQGAIWSMPVIEEDEPETVGQVDVKGGVKRECDSRTGRKTYYLRTDVCVPGVVQRFRVGPVCDFEGSNRASILGGVVSRADPPSSGSQGNPYSVLVH